MVTVPHITVYEIFEDKPSIEVGKLLSPDQLFALAAGMSWVENNFMCLISQETLGKLVMVYKKNGDGMPKMGFEDFARFCKACADVGKIVDDPSWQVDPNGFTKRSRAFLMLLFFMDPRLEADIAKAGRLILRLFDNLLKDEIEHWDDPTPWHIRLLRVVLFPIGILARWRQPGCFENFDKAMAIKAREAIERVSKLCAMAEDGRVFAFDPPEDQFKTTLELDGLRIRQMKDGGAFFG